MADHPAARPPAPDLQPEPATPAEPSGPPLPQRFWVAALVGTGLALLAGWLLMPPLAPIMHVLGLFFFLLVGLLIGAVTYRFAVPAAPIPRRRLLALTAVIGLTLWSATMVKEYLHFPTKAVELVQGGVRRAMPLTPERRQAIETEVPRAIAERLKSEYPPGGFLGYLRWNLVSGEMDVPRVVDTTRIHFMTPQRRVWWAVRVVLSLLFTAGAFASQVLPLGPKPPAPPETPDSESAKL
jgi:hypothetical protein